MVGIVVLQMKYILNKSRKENLNIFPTSGQNKRTRQTVTSSRIITIMFRGCVPKVPCLHGLLASVAEKEFLDVTSRALTQDVHMMTSLLGRLETERMALSTQSIPSIAGTKGP